MTSTNEQFDQREDLSTRDNEQERLKIKQVVREQVPQTEKLKSPPNPTEILQMLIAQKEEERKNRKPSINNDPLAKIKAEYALGRVGCITKIPQLIDLIRSVSNNGKINKSKLLNQVSKLELFEFIFQTKGEFLSTAAKDLGFQCLDFLCELGFGPNVVERLFGSQSEASKILVGQLNEMKDKSFKDKAELLSKLMSFNEKGVEEITRAIGTDEIIEILEQIKQEAQIKKRFSRDNEYDFFDGSKIDPALINRKMYVGELDIPDLKDFIEEFDK